MSYSLQPCQKRQWRHVFGGTLQEIASAAEWIDSIAAAAGLSENQAFSMQVCLEELMSNIVQHGRTHSRKDSVGCGALTISIAIDAYDDRIMMTVEDNAQPFDLAKAVAKKVDRPLDQLEPGGLGVHLIKSFASALEYERTDRGNRVTVEFKG